MGKLFLMSILLLALLFGQGLNFGGIGASSWHTGETTAFGAETKVTTIALNLRTGPGTSYSVILTMPKGSLVTVLSTANGWSKVTYEGTTGYAYDVYLASVTGSEYIITYGVNLRTGPGISYPIIQLIPKGSRVQVLSISGGWAKVICKDKTGYAWAAYLSPVSSVTYPSYYTTAALNLRSGPGLTYAILLTMPKGAGVTVYRIADHWASVSYQGTTGYASMTYLSTTPPSSDPVSPTTLTKIYKGITPSTTRRMAITFDDGAPSDHVIQVLDILDRYNAKSTFFFTGEWILSHPITSRKIISRGHTMESHTVTHPYLTTLSDSGVAYELTRSRAIIKDTVGTTATMIRPPYGDTSLRVERIAGENGYRYMVMWSIDTDDYKSTSTAASITRKAVDGAYNNAILLLHPTHQRVLDALPEILRQLRDKGYSFTTVNDMVP